MTKENYLHMQNDGKEEEEEGTKKKKNLFAPIIYNCLFAMYQCRIRIVPMHIKVFKREYTHVWHLVLNTKKSQHTI